MAGQEKNIASYMCLEEYIKGPILPNRNAESQDKYESVHAAIENTIVHDAVQSMDLTEFMQEQHTMHKKLRKLFWDRR